jgi:sugar phosphate permease
MFAVLAVSGAFRSPLFTATSTLMYAEIPAAEIAGATALANVVQQVTGALAISLVALFLNLAVIVRHGTTGSPDVADFRLAFMTSGLIALAAFVPLWRLPHDTGAEVSGHAHRPR